MKSTDLLGWKHGFPHAMAIPDDMLVVGLVRDAVPWVRSMHAKPWHSDPAIQRLEFPDFLRSPWHSLIDRKDYFKGAEEAGVVGQPLQHDRHPITGRVFDNILEMRAVKLRALLGFFERDCNFLLLRAERVQEDPKAATRDILKALSFSQPEQFKGVHKRVGSKFNSRVGQRPPTPESLDEADLEFLRSSLDIELERTLGYSY